MIFFSDMCSVHVFGALAPYTQKKSVQQLKKKKSVHVVRTEKTKKKKIPGLVEYHKQQERAQA